MSSAMWRGVVRAPAGAAQHLFAWGQAHRMHDDEDGLTVMALALGLVILLVPLAIVLLTFAQDSTADAEAAFDGAVAGT